VAFDSDGSNLVRGDRNRDTDVFVRDVRRGRTERVSLTDGGAEGDNDSFYPRISASGRFVAFESFAENLYPGDAKGEDVFVRDRVREGTSLMSVTSKGRARGPERVRQLLQRPALSDDGSVVALTSTAPLVGSDRNRLEDAYVQHARPARARISLRGTTFRIRTSDRRAKRLYCRILRRGKVLLKGPCKRSGDLGFLAPDTYTLQARASGPGILPSAYAARRFRRP
jgi:hypothetical protein